MMISRSWLNWGVTGAAAYSAASARGQSAPLTLRLV